MAMIEKDILEGWKFRGSFNIVAVFKNRQFSFPAESPKDSA
jgi:hypothetical protein